jgi:NitT/TauT family transport system ATP-binding protein
MSTAPARTSNPVIPLPIRNVSAESARATEAIHFSADDLITVSGLGKTFDTPAGAVEVLKLINFSVRDGQFVSLLGPSGCGKSTLLMLLAGLERASEGSVRIDGKVTREPYERAGIAFQDPTLMPWRSALDNVLFPVVMKGQSAIKYIDRARQLLEQVGLSEASQRRPRQLSGGMRQRVALCRALINDPMILFLDEPFSALDAITRDEMNQVLLDLWDRHRRTALFVTHSIREAALLSDRILVMSAQPGTIIADIRVDFPRPRDFSITSSPTFNALCDRLRALVLNAHGAARQGRGGGDG